MDYISDANEVTRRLNAFAFSAEAPELLADRLQLLPGSQADRICEGAELLYAHRDLLPESGLEVMGQLFLYARAQNWTVFNAENRCGRIVDGVRRDLGEEGEWSLASEDPAPRMELRLDGIDWRVVGAGPEEPVEEEPEA